MGRFKLYFIAVVLYSGLCADEIKIGTSFLKMNYVETSRDGEFLDSEMSDFTDIDGFNLMYKKDLGKLGKDMSINSISLSFRQLTGASDYDGFLQNNLGVIVAPYKSVTKNKIIESKVRVERTYYSSSYDYGVFASFGNREWTRDMSGSPFGFNEIYDWKYFDVGAKTVYYNGHWEIGVEAAYQKAIDPTMIAYLNTTMKFDLGDTTGYYLKIPLGYNIDKNFKIELEYEYNYWEIGASNIVNGYYEPDSVTKNEIVSLNLSYKF